MLARRGTEREREKLRGRGGGEGGREGGTRAERGAEEDRRAEDLFGGGRKKCGVDRGDHGALGRGPTEEPTEEGPYIGTEAEEEERRLLTKLTPLLTTPC